MQLDAHEKKQMRGVDDIEHQLLVLDSDLHKPSRKKSLEDISAKADPNLIKYGQQLLVPKWQNDGEDQFTLYNDIEDKNGPKSEVKVLIVEDNVFSCLALSTQLQQFSIECDKV